MIYLGKKKSIQTESIIFGIKKFRLGLPVNPKKILIWVQIIYCRYTKKNTKTRQLTIFIET